MVHRYWTPLYAYARREGLSREDAEDATQDFLSEWVHGDMLANADPAKGRFRSYLLTIWKRFLIDRRRSANQKRRGGGVRHFSIDRDSGERQWKELSAKQADADQLFLLSWAKSILAETHRQVADAYQAERRKEVFERLIPYLTTTVDATACQQLANQLSMTTNAVRVALHRLRHRFGETLRNLVASTVDDPNEVESEISDLLRAMQRQV